MVFAFTLHQITFADPMAVATYQKNSIFTNVAETSEGKVYWEGLEEELQGRDDVKVTDWMGNPWKLGDPNPAAHPNSRFCAPAKQCPIIHPNWESPSKIINSLFIHSIYLNSNRGRSHRCDYFRRSSSPGSSIGF